MHPQQRPHNVQHYPPHAHQENQYASGLRDTRSLHEPAAGKGRAEYAIWPAKSGTSRSSIIPTAARPTHRFGSLSGSAITATGVDGFGLGDSYDNALMENFFSTLKSELVYRRSWRTRREAANELFTDIDGWYNTERFQARVGWLTRRVRGSLACSSRRSQILRLWMRRRGTPA